MYERDRLETAQVVCEWEDGVCWIAHPDEGGKRTSHALRGEDGLWILDPLDASNVDEFLDPLGDVAGVAVLSCWHARDADVFASRYDVAVHVPEWMDRVEERVDAPVKRYTLSPGESEFDILPCRPFPRWQEVFLYDSPTKTLVIPDSMGTIEPFRLGDERLGLELFRRLQPPEQLHGLEPERILVGHGPPVTENATEALQTALEQPRRKFPIAVIENGTESIRSILGAVR